MVDPSPTAEQACIDAMAEGMRQRSNAHPWPDYLWDAQRALAALFRPGEKECETCSGTLVSEWIKTPPAGGEAAWLVTTRPGEYGVPCPDCHNGRVPTPPPILALVAERLPAELVETLIGQGVLKRLAWGGLVDGELDATFEDFKPDNAYDYDVEEVVSLYRVVLPAPTEEP